jgi:hypothetical protein
MPVARFFVFASTGYGRRGVKPENGVIPGNYMRGQCRQNTSVSVVSGDRSPEVR